MNEEQLHAIIHGRVQGVGFRAFVSQHASGLGLTGWTRNRHDGTVEVLAEGPRPALDNLLRMLQKGPSVANVTQVATDWKSASGEFSGFHVRWSW